MFLALILCLAFVQFICGTPRSRAFFFCQSHSPVLYLRLALDVGFIFYSFILSSLFILYSIFIFVLGRFVQCRQLVEITDQLRRPLLTHLNSRQKMKVSAKTYASLIERFRRLHNSILQSLYLSKVHFVDSTMLVLVLCNLQVGHH